MSIPGNQAQQAADEYERRKKHINDRLVLERAAQAAIEQNYTLGREKMFTRVGGTTYQTPQTPGSLSLRAEDKVQEPRESGAYSYSNKKDGPLVVLDEQGNYIPHKPNEAGYALAIDILKADGARTIKLEFPTDKGSLDGVKQINIVLKLAKEKKLAVTLGPHAKAYVASLSAKDQKNINHQIEILKKNKTFTDLKAGTTSERGFGANAQKIKEKDQDLKVPNVVVATEIKNKITANLAGMTNSDKADALTTAFGRQYDVKKQNGASDITLNQFGQYSNQERTYREAANQILGKAHEFFEVSTRAKDAIEQLRTENGPNGRVGQERASLISEAEKQIAIEEARIKVWDKELTDLKTQLQADVAAAPPADKQALEAKVKQIEACQKTLGEFSDNLAKSKATFVDAKAGHDDLMANPAPPNDKYDKAKSDIDREIQAQLRSRLSP